MTTIRQSTTTARRPSCQYRPVMVVPLNPDLADMVVPAQREDRA